MVMGGTVAAAIGERASGALCMSGVLALKGALSAYREPVMAFPPPQSNLATYLVIVPRHVASNLVLCLS